MQTIPPPRAMKVQSRPRPLSIATLMILSAQAKLFEDSPGSRITLGVGRGLTILAVLESHTHKVLLPYAPTW